MTGNGELFQRAWLAFSEGRVDDVAELLHPAVELHGAMLDEVFHGPAAARHWIAALSREWKSLTVVLDEVRELPGGEVLALGAATAFDYGGEQRADRDIAWLTEYADGRIVRSRVFADAAEAEAYVGSARLAA